MYIIVSHIYKIPICGSPCSYPISLEASINMQGNQANKTRQTGTQKINISLGGQ